MTTRDTPEAREGRDAAPATPEESWAILRESAERQRETARQMRETDRRLKLTFFERSAGPSSRLAVEAA